MYRLNTLITEVNNHIGIIRFNRPEVRNAVNLQMMQEFYEQLKQWKDDDHVRVLVITGNDDKAFVSGGDVEQLHQFKMKEEIEPILSKMANVLSYLANWGKPTIAMINGFAIGGGCEIATSCDFRFAREDAKLGFVQINIGITTGWGGGTRLLQKLNRSSALQLLLTGDRLLAKEAQQLGFIDRVYAPDELENKTFEFAQMIASKNNAVVKRYIEMANSVRNTLTSEEELVHKEVEQCSILWEKDEHHEAVEKFLRETRK